MELRHIPWQEIAAQQNRRLGEGVLRRSLEGEGYEVVAWRDPADRVYAPHSHPHDESLWVLRGHLVFRIEDREIALGPGDRLELPRGVVHAARAGPEGATYLIGQRRLD